ESRRGGSQGEGARGAALRVVSVRVVESLEIPAPAATVYGLIADYRVGHPSILPPEFFRDLVVERGGYGAGTVIRFTMVACGRETHARATVTEPEPGRVLLETDEATGTTTHFIVEPLAADRTRVTFETLWPRKGLLGWVVGLMVPGYLRTVYR